MKTEKEILARIAEIEVENVHLIYRLRMVELQMLANKTELDGLSKELAEIMNQEAYSMNGLDQNA